MRGIRLSTVLLLIIIAALVFALVAETTRTQRVERPLQAESEKLRAQLQLEAAQNAMLQRALQKQSSASSPSVQQQSSPADANASQASPQ